MRTPGLYAYNQVVAGSEVAKMKVRLEEVAAAAGVSRMTVSNTYSRPSLVSPATREKVFRAAELVGYGGPNPAGRSLRRGRAGVLGLLMNDALSYAFTDPGAGQFLHGLADEATKSELALQVIAAGPGRRADAVSDAVVDGFVAFALADDDVALSAAIDRRLPFVTAGGPTVEGFDCVTIDNEGSAADLARAVVARRKLRVAVVTWRLHPDGFNGRPDLDRRSTSVFEVFRERMQGYLRGAREAGVDSDGIEVFECAVNDRAAGRMAGLELMTAHARGLVVFAATDALALGVLDAARELGVRVPDDVGVAGFDDIETASLSMPPLTTVRQPLFAQGQLCARLAQAPRGRTHTFPTERILRASTTPNPLARRKRRGSS